MGLATKVMGKIARLRPVNLNVNFVQSGTEFVGRRALVLGGVLESGLQSRKNLSKTARRQLCAEGDTMHVAT